MARKTINYTVADEGRDFGKLFVLREMAASQAERWAVRAFLAMARNGIEVPDGLMEAGMAGMASAGLGMLTKIPYDEASVLMDEMFQCVTIQPSTNITRALVEDDIEEIATRIKLRAAVFKLHVDFSKAAAPSTPAQPSAA